MCSKSFIVIRSGVYSYQYLLMSDICQFYVLAGVILTCLLAWSAGKGEEGCSSAEAVVRSSGGAD
jgi:hypothetical protein